MILSMVAITGAVFFMILGIRYPRFEQSAIRRDLIADLMHALVNGPLLELPLAFCLAKSTLVIRQATGPEYLEILHNRPLWLQAFVFIFIGDLVKWILHLLQHKIPLLWRFHRVHHCSQQMDTLSHARSHPVEAFINRIAPLLIFVVILGIDLRIIAVYTVADLLQGLWIHSNTHIRLGWVNYVFSTQEFHHWHHANHVEAIDKNFGGFLSIWDWVFGTAYCPKNKDIQKLGISEINPPSISYIDHLLLPLSTISSQSNSDRDVPALT